MPPPLKAPPRGSSVASLTLLFAALSLRFGLSSLASPAAPAAPCITGGPVEAQCPASRSDAATASMGSAGPRARTQSTAQVLFCLTTFLRSLFVAVEPRLSRCWFREPLKAAARRVGPAARLARTHLEEGVRARCARRGDAGGKARLPGGQLTGRTGRGHAVGGLGQRRGGCVPGRPAGCLRGGGHAARAIEDGDRARRVEWIARRRVVVRHGHDQAQVRAQAAQVAWGAPASAATLRRRTPRRVRGARDVSHAASCPTATSTLS